MSRSEDLGLVCRRFLLIKCRAMNDPIPDTPKRHDPYAAFRHPAYRRYFLANFLGVFGNQMVKAAVAWKLYEQTHSTLTLGLVGLTLAIPHFIFFLPAGSAADRHDRKGLFLGAQAFLLVASLTLGFTHQFARSVGAASIFSFLHPHTGLSQGTYLSLVYGSLLLMGGAFAFLIPAKQSLFPRLVPRNDIQNAVTWNTSAFQVAAVSGPALAGFLLSKFPGGTVFFIDAGLSLLVLGLVASLDYVHEGGELRAIDWKTLVEGIKFVKDTQLILATITLDLFGVLFGGAMAMLPVYASDILHVGPLYYGYLQAGPFLGAVVMTWFLAHRPLRKAGKTLLFAVAGFGLGTVVFGFSRNYWLSLAMMVLIGGFDCVSVILRGTLVQVLTPDRLMGRVQAVNFLFITSSNELGYFESGAVASLLGPVFSVVSGGIVTILVVLGAVKKWPELLKLDELKPVKRIE